MNHLCVIGRLTKEIELKELGSERLVVNNTIAINRSYKADNGEDTDFLAIVAWGKRAEILYNYCRKGDNVGLEGKIQTRKYENPEGKMVYITEMLVNQITLLEQKRKNSNLIKSISSKAPSKNLKELDKKELEGMFEGEQD